MKNIIKLLFLFFVFISCNSQSKIVEKTVHNHPKLDKNQYDVILITEIKEIFNIAIDLPELQQYFHIEQIPERSPLKVLESGNINSKTLKGLNKFGKPIKVLTKEEITSSQIEDYLEIGGWSFIDGKLKLKMYYLIEGITINYMFEKAENEWGIIDSVIIEE